jgi:hypothetical protein
LSRKKNKFTKEFFSIKIHRRGRRKINENEYKWFNMQHMKNTKEEKKTESFLSSSNATVFLFFSMLTIDLQWCTLFHINLSVFKPSQTCFFL